MLINVYDNSLQKIISLTLDEAVAWICAFNIRDDFLYETIKTFAIMARTDIARRLETYNGAGCENNSDVTFCTKIGHCLEYGLSKVDIPDIVYDAVLDTDKKIITFEGRAIKPYFHYRCGGSTENSENVMGNRITYIRKVLCSYCNLENDCDSEKEFTVDELEKFLNTKMKKPEDMLINIRGMFEDIEVDDQNRIKSIKIGCNTFRGTEIMELLELNSTRFNYTPVKFLIKSIGTGHGLGLCQCGANNMARLGYSYEDILKYYYTGVLIEDIILPQKDRPLLGKKIVLDAGLSEICDEVENYINLDIVKRLGELLKIDGASVYLTRDSDKKVALSDRADISNKVRPDLFLSIQQNRFMNPSASGAEIYHYRDDNEGEILCQSILKELKESLSIKTRGVRVGDYYLLREIKVTAIILELLYITNPDDNKKLMDESFRQKAAEAIHRAIVK